MTYEIKTRTTETAVDPAVDGHSLPPDLPERFRLIRQIGRGGQGEVWLAVDVPLGQRVALKIINIGESAKDKQRIVREAQVGRNLAHRNLIRVFDLVELQKHLLMVMEWLPGGSLKDRLGERGQLPIPEIVDIAEQTLAVLSYLHEQGILHRDIKPSNLLRDGKQGFRLADLGLVRSMDDEEGLTRTGLVVGTPDYMSPEQVQGLEMGPPSDLYSLGVTLFELLTGMKPFTGSSSFEVARQHLMTTPRNVRRKRSDCPRYLANFVSRLLEKRPRDRWPDAASANTALRRRWAPRWRRWRHAALLAAAAGVFATAGWLVVDLQRPRLDSVVTKGNNIVALDRHQNELWRREFDGRVAQPQIADLIGDENPDILIARNHTQPSTGIAELELLVLDQSGATAAQVTIDGSMLATYYPHLSNDISGGALKAVDLDGDEQLEVLWTASHPWWYPSMLGSWRPRNGDDVEYLLINSGRILKYGTANLDEDPELEIVSIGLNNPLGYQTMLIAHQIRGLFFSPDHLATYNPDTNLAYVPIGFLPIKATIAVQNGGRTEIQPPGAEPIIFDISTLATEDRQRFWTDLRTLCRQLTMLTDDLETRIDDFRHTYETLLEDEGLRLASSLMVAETLARAGANGTAISILGDALEKDPELSDLWLRHGEQNLITGQRASGRRSLRQSLIASKSGRNPYDAPLFLTLEASMQNDEDAYAEAIQVWMSWAETNFSRYPDDFSPAWPFFRGNWKATGFSLDITSILMKPCNVMRLWARLELGGDPGALLTAAQTLTEDPETSEAARILSAHILLKLGRIDDARINAEEALTSVTQKARTSYEDHIWLPPAEWVMGTVLEAQGNSAARSHFKRAYELAPDTWFGADAAGRR